MITAESLDKSTEQGNRSMTHRVDVLSEGIQLLYYVCYIGMALYVITSCA